MEPATFTLRAPRKDVHAALPQAAEKLVLAEGSKLVMVALQSAYSQGVYGLVTNLGSLVVRTLFQVRMHHPCARKHPSIQHCQVTQPVASTPQLCCRAPRTGGCFHEIHP